jgi:hypothetical protein
MSGLHVAALRVAAEAYVSQHKRATNLFEGKERTFPKTDAHTNRHCT